jgi:ribokinase
MPRTKNKYFSEDLFAVAKNLRVLVVGTLNVDTILNTREFPKPDNAEIVDSIVRCPGGHAGNCAAGLASLGVSVRLLAAVGDDENGSLLLSDLEELGVDLSRIQKVANVPTGQVFIPTSGGRHFMLLARAANDFLEVNLEDEVGKFDAQAVVIFDPPISVLHQLKALKLALISEVHVFWCPGPVNSRNGELCSSVLPHVNTVVLNEGEGKSIRVLLSESKCIEIVTTHGARGSMSEMDGEQFWADAFKVDVLDTIGSGDAFLSAYVLASRSDLEPVERLTLGNAYGALAAQREGARSGLVSLEEMLTFIASKERLGEEGQTNHVR